jgi:DNA polymerase III delta subunit
MLKLKEIGRQIGKNVEKRTLTFENGAANLLRNMFGRKPGADNDTGSHDSVHAKLAAEANTRPDITRDEAERLILF